MSQLELSGSGAGPAPASGPGEGTRAWRVVAAYALLVAVTQMLWLTFAPIDTDVGHDFGVSKVTVGWLANVFPLIYVALALPAGIALDRWFRGSLLVGGTLTAAGAVVRVIAQSFAGAMVGQLVVAVAQPLVLNSLTKTATGYLPPEERAIGIAVASAGQFVGAIAALVMGPTLEGRHSLGTLLSVQAVVACVALVGVALALRRPPASAGPRAAIGRGELSEMWSLPLTRTLAWLAFVGVGVFVAISTYLQPILHHDRISSDSAGFMLAAMLVAGTIGCGVTPPLVARRRAERRYLSGAVVWVAGCMILMALLHPVAALDYAAVAAMGFVLLAALPVILELVERRMGASGGVATGILLLAGNAGGLIVAVVLGAVSGVPAVAFLVLAAVAVAGLPAARRLPVGAP